jgi:hypothetical protein
MTDPINSQLQGDPIAHISTAGGSFYIFAGEEELLALAKTDPSAFITYYKKEDSDE